MKYLLATMLSLVLASTGWCEQLNVVVVFDGSGSMGERFSKSQDRSTRMEAAKKALTQMVPHLPANTNLGIICFSGSTNGWLVKLGTLNKNETITAINSVREGGGTPLGKYMRDGANALLELRAKQKSGVYKLIIVTDGESSDDADTPLTGQYGILSKGLRVEAIGVDMKGTHTLATKVAYRSADSPEQLTTAVKAVVAESSGKNDHSEDYDLIAPLPPEVAMAALTALSEFDNTPIGQKPKSGVSFNDGSGGGSGIGTTLAIVFSVLLAGVLIVGIVIFVCNKR